jgi:hypothetical protein
VCNRRDRGLAIGPIVEVVRELDAELAVCVQLAMTIRRYLVAGF